VYVKLGLRGVRPKHHIVWIEGLVPVFVLLQLFSDVPELALPPLLDYLTERHELVKHYVLSVAELFDTNGVFADKAAAYVGDSLWHDLSDDAKFGVEGLTEEDGKVYGGVGHPALVVLVGASQVLMQEKDPAGEQGQVK
jgi:hypothetical protein